MQEKVEAALERIRPWFWNKGANVQVLKITDGVVEVRLMGPMGG